MTISRRQALQVSGTTVAGLSLGLRPESLFAQAPPAQTPQPVPDKLVDATVRNIAPLPLNPDGSAPEHAASEAGTITEPYMWRYTNAKAPEIEYDYRKLKIKVDARGMAKRSGTMSFADLEPLPRHSYVTLLSAAPSIHTASSNGPACDFLMLRTCSACSPSPTTAVSSRQTSTGSTRT